VKIEIVTDSKEIQKMIPRCMALAKKSDALFPFCFPALSIQWWNHFNNKDGSIFWQKRGANFFGRQSRLEKFYLIIVEQNGKLCGFAPFVALSVLTTANKNKQRVLCYAGDPVLMPYQGITVDPTSARTTIFTLFEHLIRLFKKEEFNLLFLGYELETSSNISLIRDFFSQTQTKQISVLEAVSSIRGGIRPWTIRQLSRRVRKVADQAINKDISLNDSGLLCDKLSECPPLKLLFPGTRKVLEQELESFLTSCRAHQSLNDVIAPVEDLLHDRPICYPYIDLPENHESFMATLSSSTRYYYRRYMKSFINKGGSFETVRGKDISDQDINDYLHLHKARWGRESMFINNDSHEFHIDISKLMAEHNLFSLFFARYDGERIAVLSSFDINRRRECYFTGMNPEFQKTRAGRLLWLHSIYDAIDSGFTTYDLGPGDFGYKMSFATGEDRTHCFLVTAKDNNLDLDLLFTGYECMVPYNKSENN